MSLIDFLFVDFNFIFFLWGKKEHLIAEWKRHPKMFVVEN
jgi:hypothetical protein